MAKNPSRMKGEVYACGSQQKMKSEAPTPNAAQLGANP
jgi:hypothetical protein